MIASPAWDVRGKKENTRDFSRVFWIRIVHRNDGCGILFGPLRAASRT